MPNETSSQQFHPDLHWTAGAKYLCIQEGEEYRRLAVRPDDMTEEVWGELCDFILEAIDKMREDECGTM